MPPLRFACVEQGVYRGAYPSLINLRFLRRLRLRSVISLLPEQPSPDLVGWCQLNGVQHYAEAVAVPKDEVLLTHERAAELLRVALHASRLPRAPRARRPFSSCAADAGIARAAPRLRALPRRCRGA